MNGQKDHWNELHTKGALDYFSKNPSLEALEFAKYLSPNSKILELGCGVGNDSNFFVSQGHTVSATDFSEIAIEKNKEFYKDPNLTFEVLDMEKPFQFEKNTFDAVYARLSLHYFTDVKTREIFKEISRILNENGLLCFVCKSTKDSLYGQGELIEPDMYRIKGHIRHFFSEEYVKDLLADDFVIDKIETGDEKFYEDISSFVKAVARKK